MLRRKRPSVDRATGTRTAPAEVGNAEVAEPRVMMSGNVTAEVVDGVLTLTGDRTRNTVEVELTEDGRARITSPSTRINGSLGTVELTAPDGKFAGISANLGRGRDRVRIVADEAATRAVEIDGDVDIVAGQGHDRIWLENLDVSGSLEVNGGTNNDSISLISVSADDVRIVGARGADSIGLRDVQARGNTVVYGGHDADRIVSLNVTSGGRTRLYGETGPDAVIGEPGDVIRGHAGRDFVRSVAKRFVDYPLTNVVIDELNEAAGGEVHTPIATVDLTEWPDGSAVEPPSPTNTPYGGFTRTDSGIYYRILGGEAGASRPTRASTVTVNYHGQFVNGAVFDSSFDRGQTSTFPLSQVILGWQEAIPLMGVGQQMQVFIPPELAYGAQGTSTIPGNTTLFFSVELISFT